MAAVFSTMFHAFLRLGEVTASPHNIQFNQVALESSSVAITFSSFKHHQGPPITLSIQASASENCCLVKLLKSYLTKRGSTPGPLFCFPGNLPIQPARFRSLLSYAIARANLASLYITPHSFRIGAATFATTQGLSSSQIQAMGRWRSNAFQKLLRIATITVPHYSLLLIVAHNIAYVHG